MSYSEINENDVSVIEKADRIRARRERIEQKTLESLSNKNDLDEQGKNNASIRRKSQQRIVDSMSVLGQKKSDGLLNITKVRVAVEHRENQRRMKEEQHRHCRMQILDQASEESAANRQGIFNGWDALGEIRVPQELHQMIERQKIKCSQLLDQKIAIVKSFRAQHKEKDEDYTNALKEQAKEIDVLKEIMEANLTTLKESYGQELAIIEESFVQDRNELIEANRKGLIGLSNKKSSMEEAHMAEKQYRRERSQEKEKEAQLLGDEGYNNLKHKLEAEVRDLECKLEEARTTYNLNTDKQEYKLRILVDRKEQHEDIIKKNKKRLLKSKEELNKAMEKYSTNEAQDQRKNEGLERDCQRLDKQCHGLHSKFRRFEMADEQKYAALLEMHMEEVSTLASRIQTAEGLINKLILDAGGTAFNSSGEDMAEMTPGCNYEKAFMANLKNPSIEVSSDTSDEEKFVNTSFSDQSANERLVEMSNIITDQTFESWRRLETMLTKYNELLERRKSLAEKVGVITEQNTQLEVTLDRCLSDKINEELIIPPLDALTK